jgi:hypothetical protein
MKKAVVLGLILVGVVPAQAVQLSLSETFGAAYLFGEDRSDQIQPGPMVSQSVLFEFDGPLTLDVSYFSGTRIITNTDNMKSEALSQERAAMQAWISDQGYSNATGEITIDDDLRLFEDFTSNLLWGGASLRYNLGDREGRSWFLGLGASYFSTPRVDYGYGFNNIDVTYEEEGATVETLYTPETVGRKYNNVTSVVERSGIAAAFSLGMAWKLGDLVRFHANMLYNLGISEDLQMLGGGLGVILTLP